LKKIEETPNMGSPDGGDNFREGEASELVLILRGKLEGKQATEQRTDGTKDVGDTDFPERGFHCRPLLSFCGV
jgi:hypothetical protein